MVWSQGGERLGNRWGQWRGGRRYGLRGDCDGLCVIEPQRGSRGSLMALVVGCKQKSGDRGSEEV